MVQKLSQQELCIICLDPITNPICEECHINEIETWLIDLNLTKEMIRKTKKEIRKIKTKKEYLNESYCVICQKQRISTCSYCFFLRVAKKLKKLNFPYQYIEDFLEIFNYRHGHSDYYI